jgi:hypothetical protein
MVIVPRVMISAEGGGFRERMRMIVTMGMDSNRGLIGVQPV